MDQFAHVLAESLGGTVTLMPRSRMPGLRLDLASGKVSLLDETGCITYRSAADLDAYAEDGDDSRIAFAAEWPAWGVSESWARPLARILGGEAVHTGGNVWVVVVGRPDWRVVVVGEDGVVTFPNRTSYDRGDDESCPGVTFTPFNRG